MKRTEKLFFTMAASLICCGAITDARADVPEQNIHDGWRFKQARLTNWYPATVPGVVHTDLLDNGIIEDPFFRLNERGLQWIDKEDWVYETEFDVDPAIFFSDNIEMIFEGLDTYADVFLNRTQILSADNMFRRWEADVKSVLKGTGNVLTIYFHSPVKVDMPKWEALPFHYDAINDQSENGGLQDRKISIFARKAGYHYGWDWGPRLVTSGIWRPVKIRGWNDARISNVQYTQEDVFAKSATVTNTVEITADKDMEIIVSVLDMDHRFTTGTVVGGKTVKVKKGINTVPVKFTVKNPKLWWSNGLGEPHLYNFHTVIGTKDKGTLDTDNTRIGIRSVKLVRDEDSDGRSFYFVLNGVPVFAKGANYIPSDNFLPRVTRQQYEQTIKDAVDVNMNMLRVWGGGIYEDDYFYELCDENGIMVWQDFMFACAMYPAEGQLLENIRLEAIDNVRRLRNHSSIVIWCGNNENQDAWFGWDWKENMDKVNPEYSNIIWKQYEQQYFQTLPEVVKEYGSGIAYTSSSPFSDYGKTSNSYQGDRHYWGVWHGKEPITAFNTERSRFFSEYGFQSFPGFESVKLFAPESGDWDIRSEVMMSHQRGGDYANSLIETYLLNEYYTPKDFQSMLYISHILQGDAIKTAVEAHRRDMPYCMGTLYWQHNDCWPVASWSSRDWYGVWKAQHYFMRHAFADILVSPIERDGVVDFYLVSDRLKDARGDLSITVYRLDGTAIMSTRMETVTARANTSEVVTRLFTEELLCGADRSDVVIHARFTTGDDVYRNNYFLEKQKDMNYPKAVIHNRIRRTGKDNGYEITLGCDTFARGVFFTVDGVEHSSEDNYFDLLPGEKRIVMMYSDLPLREFEEQFRIVTLSDTY